MGPAAARPTRATLLVLSLVLCTGCALFRASEPEPIELPIPESQEAIRAEIEIERSRLLDLLNADLPDAEAREAHRRVVVTIAARLSRLDRALEAAAAKTEAGR